MSKDFFNYMETKPSEIPPTIYVLALYALIYSLLNDRLADTAIKLVRLIFGEGLKEEK